MTGYAGQPHVAAADQGSLFEALIRSGQFVMEAGAKFAASVVTNNKIRVSDGELMMQGRHVKLNPGSYVDLTIENGAQGYLRNDLIVARYTQNAETGIEECNLVVLKGTQAASNPTDPAYTTGSLNGNGALQHDFPLYRVPLSGLNVGSLVALFVPQKPVFDSALPRAGGTMAGNIAMGGYKVSGLGTPTANGDAVSLIFANNNYAPSGYGLGTVGKACDDCNAATKSGFYSLTGETCLNAPPSFPSMRYGAMMVSNRYGSGISQMIFYLGYITARYSNDGGSTWTEWEHLNPPMVVGTEYRTAERYKESVVYKKVDANGNILWRKEGENKWHLLASASYVSDATVE